MTVFKGNMLLLKRNIGLGLMYLGIFLFITLMAQSSFKEQEDILTFDVINSKIGVVDVDQSNLSKGLVDYLARNNTIFMYENDKEVLTEALYYQDVYSIVVIPEGFAENCLEGEAVVDITNVPNSKDGIYVGMDINKFVFQVQTLKIAGFSDADIVKIAIDNAEIKSNVELVETGTERTEGSLYNFYFGYSPYVYLTVLIFMLGNILIPKNKKDMSQRLKCSPISETRQSLETFLAFAVVGIILFLILVCVAFIFSGKDLYEDNLVAYYIFNNFIFMFVSLCISFMIASVAKGQESLSGLANVVSLALCFIGGVFVPLQFLGEKIIKVAKFFPTYWYEVNNNMLGEYIVLGDKQLIKFRDGILVQIAIGVVCVTIAFLINSKKDSYVN